ncbi:Ribosomal S18 domain containing protein [Trichuris trichiura]|uniref:Small ribosomal subunit protein mS40 n=1 Tax=Trichuris trichiura TaxID=36087 RepID=A0A077YYC3_TRITR|nr:Ribosomal S18 domain containing protein [Trichuris trichiura]
MVFKPCSVRHLCSTTTEEQTQSEDAAIDPNDLGTNLVAKRKGLLRPIHSWSTSVRYLDSDTYKQTYGDSRVWELFRRNFKGQMHMPPKTRYNCVTPNGRFRTNFPCPICRDEYLVVDYRNVKLLEQFIIPQTGEIVECRKCSVCQVQYLRICVEIQKAKDRGYITFTVPFRKYNYSSYYPWWPPEKKWQSVEDEEELEVLERQSSYIIYPVHHPDTFPDSMRPGLNPFKVVPYRRSRH